VLHLEDATEVHGRRRSRPGRVHLQRGYVTARPLTLADVPRLLRELADALEVPVPVAPQPSPAIYLSPRAAGDLADVTAATIRRWIREGRLPAHRAGSRVRVLRSDLERLLRSGHSRKASSDLEDETPTQAAASLLRSVG
jgi:excisionase family DNA binding protein